MTWDLLKIFHLVNVAHTLSARSCSTFQGTSSKQHKRPGLPASWSLILVGEIVTNKEINEEDHLTYSDQGYAETTTGH